MSRRFSDEPINLIHRIPSPEQISAARPAKRLFGQALLETGAACVRTVAEFVAQLRRWGRVARTTVSRKALSGEFSLGRTRERIVGGIHTLTLRCSRSYDRLAEWIANLDVIVQPARPNSLQSSEMTDEASRDGMAKVVTVRLEELADLKTHVLNQQEDMSRLSAQIQELKSLVVSQQQVLVFLGKELELIQAQAPISMAEAPVPAKRARVVREKQVAKDKSPPRKSAQKPSLNL